MILSQKYFKEREQKRETKIKLKVKLARFKKKRTKYRKFVKQKMKKEEIKHYSIILFIFELIKVIVVLLKFLLGL
tara:strand:- start:248 stop:472 length:225 start_codon:yes stop_codon:yes gene_type:complete